MDYDKFGLIYPYSRVTVSRAEFLRVFVESHPKSSSRYGIYRSYVEFTEAFERQVTASFRQWIGGSFTTKKKNPNHIDVLTILNLTDYQANQELIATKFRRSVGAFPLVDSYFIQAPTKGNDEASLFRSDFVYWVNQFGATRLNKSGKRQNRGYIELTFNNYSYE